MFNFDPVIAERQCPELKEAFLVGSLFPDLISSLVAQRHVHVDEDGASAVLNSATNRTRGGLREHKRGHGKMRNNGEDQARLHLCSLAPEDCAEKYMTALT
jgi:hypothetical protein